MRGTSNASCPKSGRGTARSSVVVAMMVMMVVVVAGVVVVMVVVVGPSVVVEVMLVGTDEVKPRALIEKRLCYSGGAS